MLVRRRKSYYLLATVKLRLENLAKREYPGRVILAGVNPQGAIFICYAITGRSSSSQARKLVFSDQPNMISVTPTDEEELKKGNPDLLVYPAIHFNPTSDLPPHVVVSNGNQTRAIESFLHRSWEMHNGDPIVILRNALSTFEYEPDKPNFTPRISACCVYPNIALSIVKRHPAGQAIRHYFEVPLIKSQGQFISTYTGENKDPLPSFRGEPSDFGLPWENLDSFVVEVYKALGPREGKPNDFRVAVAGVEIGPKGVCSYRIKNRYGDV